MNIFKNTLAVTLMLCFGLIAGCASTKTVQKSQKETPKTEKPENDDGLKPYSEVITDEAITDEGLFTIHQVEDIYYYEIPDSLLGIEMLLVSRKAKTANNMGYGGEKVNTQTLRWEKKNDKILLRHVSFENVASDTLPIYKAVRRSNFEPILAAFDIESLGKDSTGVVIEVTNLYSSDIPSLTLSSGVREQYNIRRLDDNRSFINYIHSYPKNVEVSNLLTYQSLNPPSNSTTGTVSVVMHHSMVLLPQQKMRARDIDRRVGYFSVRKTDYGLDAQKAEQVQFITRYELIPKDKEAYLNGELTEPVEPIVYYIDRATPEKWRPYLIKGVEAWNKAFREAGFKNAIIAKMAPAVEEDSTFSAEDIRYSVIRYFASPIQNAYGPNVHDPRTGQILESDIGWYHNIMNLLRNWYFVQTAAANPKARSVEYSNELMGRLMRFVATHEVGHTLGLQHSFGSSYGYPADSLRSPSFTSTHGTAPSIMDYARFNYIAQPGDGVTNFMPRIGEYDKWAIKWGYTWFPENMSSEEIEATLDEWIAERVGNPLYYFDNNWVDPRSQTEDLSNNAMKAGKYGIQNLKVLIGNLIEWTGRPGENYQDLEELYGQIIGQYRRYIGHVMANIGGVYANSKNYNQEGLVYEQVSEEIQREAMAFLNEYAFQTPGWLLDKDILGRINQNTVVDNIKSLQSGVLQRLLNASRLNRLIEYQARYEEDTYTAFEMMNELRNGIWSELENSEPISVYRRNLQWAYLEAMEALMAGELSDARSMARNQLEILLNNVQEAQNGTGNRATEVHLDAVETEIEHALDPEE